MNKDKLRDLYDSMGIIPKDGIESPKLPNEIKVSESQRMITLEEVEQIKAWINELGDSALYDMISKGFEERMNNWDYSTLPKDAIIKENLSVIIGCFKESYYYYHPEEDKCYNCPKYQDEDSWACWDCDQNDREDDGNYDIF